MEHNLNILKERVISGGEITFQEAISLYNHPCEEELYEAASSITRFFGKPEFNPCSIINARAGRCSENCKWCAQSAHFSTGSPEHGIVGKTQLLKEAKLAESKGVKRFSQVTSGRAVRGEALKEICSNCEALSKETNMQLCASLGLLDKEELRAIKDAGVSRYHCNLETSRSYFPNLCTTHKIEDKLTTLKAAREVGLEICSGGIIGMGESAEQRVELAFNLKEIKPDSIPINILSPIKGTPLENIDLISDEDILRTIAVSRFIHPRVELRFAGGRMRLSEDTKIKAMKIGINSAIVGDLLTTTGSGVQQDRQMAIAAGYKFD